MVVTIDTNVIIYALAEAGDVRHAPARTIVDALRSNDGALSLQVCTETFKVLTAKKKWARSAARSVTVELLDSFRSFGATPASVRRAVNLADATVLSIWDANLVSAAEAAGCTHLLSEDMHDTLRIGRLEIVNPFAGDALSERARSLLLPTGSPS